MGRRTADGGGTSEANGARRESKSVDSRTGASLLLSCGVPVLFFSTTPVCRHRF